MVKFAKNAKKNLTPYRQARSKGSKKLCRRLKAIRRMHRKHDREKRRRVAHWKELLRVCKTYWQEHEPENQQEIDNVAANQANLEEAIAKHERREQERQEQAQKIEESRRQLQKISRVMETCLADGGGWNAFGDEAKKANLTL
jgi:hypothetical protein